MIKRYLVLASMSLAITQPAVVMAGAKEGLKDTLNIMRCTNQWDFTTYAHSYRLQGMSRTEATQKMFSNWMRAKEEKEFRDIMTDAIHGAVDHVYRQKQSPKKMSAILVSTNRGFQRCVTDKGLTKYNGHLKSASTKAGLVTLWDYYRRSGIRKEQIVGQSKKPMAIRLKKLLDAVYSDGFNLHRYRISEIWNPTIDTIALKFHGVKIK